MYNNNYVKKVIVKLLDKIMRHTKKNIYMVVTHLLSYFFK